MFWNDWRKKAMKESLSYFKTKGLSSVKDMEIDIYKPVGTVTYLSNFKYLDETRQYRDGELQCVFHSRNTLY